MTNEIALIRETESALLETNAEKYEAIESELNEIKDNLISAAEKIGNVIPTAIDLTEAAQNPKMYEALSRLITSYSNLNRDAAAIVKQKQELYDSFRDKKETQQPQIPHQTDNRQIHFHGTANDLLDKFLNKDK